MMKQTPFLPIWLIAFLLLTGCGPEPIEFGKLQNHFYQKVHQRFPSFSSPYLSIPNSTPLKLSFPDDAYLHQQLSILLPYQDSLRSVDSLRLSANELSAFRQMQSDLASLQEEVANLSSYRVRADFHNARKYIAPVLSNTKLSLKERLLQIGQQLADIPSYYASAQQYVHDSPILNTELAIIEHVESFQFFGNTLLDSLEKVDLAKAEKLQFEDHLAKAQRAIKQYVAFCTSLSFEHNERMDYPDSTAVKSPQPV
ncbi:MAG: hypothetical protein AAFO94_02655, partial [Bacteroidota bacterium]